LQVSLEHFKKAALEIGQSGENDTLPYDMDAAFVRDKAEELAAICFKLFSEIEKRPYEVAVKYVETLTVGSERLLVPSGSHGFRITTKIHPFWNLYLNGISLAISEAIEPSRSDRALSYRFSNEPLSFFDRSKSWRTYKENTLQDSLLESKDCVVIQTDISSFYEHVYHHRLENLIKDVCGIDSTIAAQVDRILNKISAGRSFGLPVGGQCARVLAELMMTPIDQSLSESGISWYRYVDDFTLVCESQPGAYRSLSVLSHSLADYGLSLNRSKTTIMSGKHYLDFVRAQLGDDEDDTSLALRDLDLHFDPYSDTAQTEYEALKSSFESIDIQFLLDLEKEKSQPDSFVLAQIGRALKFQEPKIAAQLCETLLDPKNLDAFRASWSKIMRGVYSVRANEDFESVFDCVDNLLDILPERTSHLLMPEGNQLHFLKLLRFKKNELRGRLVHKFYKTTSSQSVKRACIDCWRHWHDRTRFQTLRNQWQNLGPDEQRMFWLAAGKFGDEGSHAQNQLRSSTTQYWKLGFEIGKGPTFASSYIDWVKNVD
tara:strand:+ start:2330 stop:3961 length:1632 start_codon:yes stop_codon:yes gene_type:complete